MSDDRAGFLATFCDLRIVKGRKVTQFIFEVAREKSTDALNKLGGMPDPSNPVWCGIARVNPGATTREPPNKSAMEVPHEGSPGSPEQSSRGTSRDGFEIGTKIEVRTPNNRLVKQAAMCCADPVFQKFLKERFSFGHPDDTPERIVRELCGVTSRSEIRPGTKAADLWQQLYGKFLAWKIAA